jgi:predicted secreted protein
MDKNIISFIITADEDVEQDFITVTFSAAETGLDANAVQALLADRLKAALDIAKPKEAADLVEVKTGAFQIYPTYGTDNKITGYSGNVYLIVSGLDTETILGLTGVIKPMTVSNVQQSISDGLRNSVQQCLAIRAIRKWRDRATAYAGAFDVPTYSLVNADVSIDRGYYPVYAMAKAKSAGGGSGEVPSEPGKETLSVTVSGSIQLEL